MNKYLMFICTRTFIYIYIYNRQSNKKEIERIRKKGGNDDDDDDDVN